MCGKVVWRCEMVPSPIGVHGDFLKLGLVCGAPEGRMQRLPSRTLGRGASASSPRSFPGSDRLLARGLFFSIYSISLKLMVGFL